nr:ATP-binding protein [Aliikangiella sp. G2MR2-5]
MQCEKISSFEGEKFEQPLDNIVSIFQDEEGDLWIGTFNKGIVHYDYSEKSYSHYVYKEGDDLSPASNSINHITGQGNNVWISTYDKGVNLFDKATKKFSRIQVAAENLSGYSPNISLVDSKDELWVGTREKGLLKLNKQTNTLEKFDVNEGFIPSAIYAITETKAGSLWLGSKGYGAIKLDSENKIAKVFNVKNSNISSNMIWSIAEDNSGNLWMGSSKGVSKYNNEKKKFTKFSHHEGIQNEDLTSAISIDKKNGDVWLGGENGINRIIENTTKYNREGSNTQIVSFQLFYEEIDFSDSSVLEVSGSSMFDASALNLDHDQNVFSFEFSAMDYLKSDELFYAYRLKNHDERWNIVDSNKRYVSYTNILPGNYEFQVKASDNKDNWDVPARTILIKIDKAWWQTYWALSAYLFILVLSIFLLVQFRTKMLRRKAEELKSSVAERTKELAIEKAHVEKLLAHKNKEFANVSHEFRTPLTLVLGPLKSMLKIESDQDKKRKLETMQRNSYRLMRMVDQLIYMEKFRAAKEGVRKIVDLQELINHLAGAFEDLAKEKGISLFLERNEPIYVQSAPDALEKILLNLLSNAVKYTPSGQSIGISSERIGDCECQIKVSDSGIGIPEDMQHKIFGRYERVLSEYSEKITGAGIGLSLVKELIEAHNGKIELESEPGKGSCFTVYLPVLPSSFVLDKKEKVNNPSNESLELEIENLIGQSAQENMLAEVIDSKPVVEDTTKEQVLIIEDNPDMRAYIAETLAHDYQCLTAENGQQGINIAYESIPDIIISDVMMPLMDGFQVSETLKQDERTSHIPIILLTARGDRESRLTGWKSQADEYLNKPFDEEELALRVANLLTIRRILRSRFGQLMNSGDSTEVTLSQVEDISEKDKAFISRLEAIINDNLEDKSFKLPEMASRMMMGERQLQRKLKALLDVSPNEYLRVTRLKKAKEMLQKGEIIKVVAYSVGFSSIAYFSNCFKAHFGKTPNQVREGK